MDPSGFLASGLDTRSVRRTPLLADLLHRISFVEKAGTGIRRIRDEARAQGCPEPTFEVTGFVTATFFPNPTARAQAEAQERSQVTGQVGTKLALSRHQVEILAMCREDQPFVTLLAVTGRSDRTKFRNQVLNPLIEARLIEMTLPDKPRSSRQRNRPTAMGREVLKKQEKES